MLSFLLWLFYSASLLSTSSNPFLNCYINECLGRPQWCCVWCVCACGLIQTQEPHRNPITLLSPWVAHLCTVEHCGIPGIFYDPTFSRLPLFLPASGFICEAKPPTPLPFLFSRILKHFRHLSDVLIQGNNVLLRQNLAEEWTWGHCMIYTVWFVTHLEVRVSVSGDMFVCVCTLLSQPWQTGLPHVVACFDCQGKQGYSKAWRPWQRVTLAHPRGRARLIFYLCVFTLQSYIFCFAL